MNRGAATITIECAPDVVYSAVTDIERMGEWSPECTGGQWIAPATGPAVGAEFEGTNEATLGPFTVKKWTTVSQVTASVPNLLFEFVSADLTTWRYELIEIEGSTRVTESFTYDALTGVQKFVYETILRRQSSMVKGMEQTLERLKASLEGSGSAT